MTLSNRIIIFILKRSSTTLSDLERVAVRKGFTLEELYAALDTVHKDKRITATNLKDGVVYRAATAKTPPSTSHLTWVNENYLHKDMLGDPIPFYEPSTDGPTPYWSHETRKFLRELREAQKEANMTVYNKRYGKQGKKTKKY